MVQALLVISMLLCFVAVAVSFYNLGYYDCRREIAERVRREVLHPTVSRDEQ